MRTSARVADLLLNRRQPAAFLCFRILPTTAGAFQIETFKAFSGRWFSSRFQPETTKA